MKQTVRFPGMSRRLNELGFASYREFLESPLWADFRKRYRESGLPKRCLACRHPKYELHHRTYERLGNELVWDVIPLCRECHEKVHRYCDEHFIKLNATDKVLRRIFCWGKRETRKRFAPFKPPGREMPPEILKRMKQAKPKKVRFSDPWERKWMSGPLGLAVKKED